MEFLSRSDDKKLRWIITESCPQPHLINEKQLPDQDEEVKGEGDTPPKGSNEGTNQKEADSESVREEATTESMEEEKSGTTKPARGGWRGRRGRGRGDRGAILLTSLEQEMLLWALGGFLPVGPEGLKPSPEHQVRFHTHMTLYICACTMEPHYNGHLWALNLVAAIERWQICRDGNVWNYSA